MILVGGLELGVVGSSDIRSEVTDLDNTCSMLQVEDLRGLGFLVVHKRIYFE